MAEEQLAPAPDHLLLIPCLRLQPIHMQYHMVVVGHHGIGTEIDGKDSRQ
jgi:hypothetical protein